MSNVIGQGIIEVAGDSTKLEATIAGSKRSIKSLGDANKDVAAKSAAAIDRYVKRLEIQNATLGMSTRETEIYKLTLRGASDAQIKAADSALRLADAHKNGEAAGERIKTTFLAIGAAAVTGLIAAAVAFDQLVKKAGDFQDLAEKTGDTAENMASLAVAAGTANYEMSSVADLAGKLSKNLVGVDDESKAAGAALKALGLDINELKKLGAADRLEVIAKAMNGFAESAEKVDVAVALLGKSGREALPFLKELGAEGGRQVILTEEQIQLADEYADKQAKQRAEISLHAQAIATKALPALNEFSKTLGEIAKDQEFAAHASDILKGAFKLGILVFQTFALVGSDVGFVLVSVGREIGAIAAQLVALAHLDFDGFNAISEAVKEDAKKARAELDRFQAKILKMGEAPDSPASGAAGAAGSTPTVKPKDSRPKIKFDGDNKDQTEKAKAQLASDLSRIKQASDEVVSTFSNAEKIMEARRAANLIDEHDYYAAKLGFIQLNSQAQESELQQEIDRLKREKLTGKEKIENSQKITEAQAKLAKVRANATAEIELNSIRETAAAKKTAQGYVEATIAAQAYIDTLNKQRDREIAGIGRGAAVRQQEAGRDSIRDKRDEQQRALQADLRTGQKTKADFDFYLGLVNDTYAKELEAYDKRTEALKEKQADWLNGANEAFANYQSNAENVAAQTAAAFSQAYDGMTDGIASSVSKSIVYGESLKDGLRDVALSVADAFISSFIKIQIQKLFIDKAVAGAYATTIAAQSQAMVAMAGLNAFASTAAIPIVGPLAAPGAAAVATAIAEGFALTATAAAALSVASARGGFDIPAGVNPLTQLHEREMVLPAQHADVIRGLANGGGDGGNGDFKFTLINNGPPLREVGNRTMPDGERVAIVEEAKRGIADDLGNPNSRISRSIGANLDAPRKR